MKEDTLIQGALDRITGQKPIESRPAPRTAQEWLKEWRELAQATYGITKDDPRLEPVMRWLDVCEVAFKLDNWSAFQDAAERVKRLAGKKPEEPAPPCR